MCDGISLMMKCVFMMFSYNYKRDDLIKKKILILNLKWFVYVIINYLNLEEYIYFRRNLWNICIL